MEFCDFHHFAIDDDGYCEQCAREAIRQIRDIHEEVETSAMLSRCHKCKTPFPCSTIQALAFCP